jgi:RNA polymerase sigma-70 factor (ECF subfamily)
MVLDDLARRAREGDVRATRGLLLEVAPVVRRTCTGVMRGAHADLEDTIQESLVLLLRALPSYRFDGSVLHYARRIAFRASLYHRRRSCRWRDRFRLTGDVDESLCSTRPFAEDASTQEYRELTRVLHKLPPEQAEALMLRVVHDLSMNEIATLCDVPLNTVKTRLRRGKTALRRHLQHREQLHTLRAVSSVAQA